MVVWLDDSWSLIRAGISPWRLIGWEAKTNLVKVMRLLVIIFVKNACGHCGGVVLVFLALSSVCYLRGMVECSYYSHGMVECSRWLLELLLPYLGSLNWIWRSSRKLFHWLDEHVMRSLFSVSSIHSCYIARHLPECAKAPVDNFPSSLIKRVIDATNRQVISILKGTKESVTSSPSKKIHWTLIKFSWSCRGCSYITGGISCTHDANCWLSVCNWEIWFPIWTNASVLFKTSVHISISSWLHHETSIRNGCVTVYLSGWLSIFCWHLCTSCLAITG